MQAGAETVKIGNDLVQRELTFDGKAWRTTKFIAGTESLETQSDEFHIRMMDDVEFTVSDFVAEGKPVESKDGKTSVWTVRYRRPDGMKALVTMPATVTVRYTATPGERFIRKAVALEYTGEATVDRLEVERFSAKGEATRGGRGEPVFLGNRWFFGLEYPAGQSRHTDGNTPEPDKHHFEMVGNYSYVDLEGRDKDAKGRPGLIRLFHFPGYAVKKGTTWQIISKTAVAGGGAAAPVTDQFNAYLKTIEKPDRNFTHYNNWFDPAGKSLKADTFTAIYKDFAKAVKPYGVKIDAMVPDDGWQNRKSVWEPAARDFPGGFPDLVKLSDELRKEGTTLGLWLALDGTNTDIKWGESQGYPRAKPNKYFSQYFPHYSLSHPTYQELLRKQLVRLAGEAKVGYFKHDFNHLSDIGEGNGHPPTDRHGHEANVDAMISLLKSTREANPQVYQNLTNWMWFSPWWLMHGDALWMLAGDDGANGNWPELSVRNMATTDRDTFLWRMWGDAADRPLVPVSRLMTHGIILNEKHQLEGPGDGVREWADHVMMYYGRGIQMKEWYITPKTATPEHWKALGTIHRWAEKNFKALANASFVGGRPDEGHVYGYIGWDNGHGVLVTRNPSAETQTLEIPFGSSSDHPLEFHSRVVFPYHDDSSATYWTGKPIRIEVPGYQTLALEFSSGRAKSEATLPTVAVKLSGKEASAIIPADTKGRAEVLVIGYPNLPEVKINGQAVSPLRTSKSKLNPFPYYARAGMPSDKARAWTMASFDAKAFIGKEVKVSLGSTEGDEGTAEAWLLTERAARDASFSESDVPWAIDAGLRRQTTRLIAEAPVTTVQMESRALTPAELAGAKTAKLTISLFGVNPRNAGEKTLWLNGSKLIELPAGVDEWQSQSFNLDAEAIKGLKASNTIEVRRSTGDDRFKFRSSRLRVQLADGTWVQSSQQQNAQTTDKDWAFFEGEVFATKEASAPVTLEFK
ncbi:MAG: hypothetical protein QM755_05485 [Luteolibacter sp.]